MIVAGILPLVGLALAVLVARRAGLCWRGAGVAAGLAWGGAVTLLSEGLSLFSLIAYTPLLISWLGVAVGLAVAWRLVGPLARAETSGPRGSPGLSHVLVAVTAGIALTTGVIAVVAAPNTWDSLTYHMSRVAHWVQNRSVALYPTHDLRQAALGPWSEFAILHLQVLSGGDRLAGLVQWLAMLGSLCGVSLLTRELGGSATAQAWSALFLATAPMGVLQSSSTQTDYVHAFWLVAFAWLLVRWKHRADPSHDGIQAVGLGLSLGLAYLTKQVAYLYAVPLGVWLAIEAGRRGLGRGTRALAIVVAVTISINAGHGLRSLAVAGTPLGGGLKSLVANQDHSPRSLASNLVRNLALHVDAPTATLRRGIDAAIERLRLAWGMDFDDPRTTFGGTFVLPWHRRPELALHEDHAGNPVHALLIAVSLGILAWRGHARGPTLAAHAAVLVAAFLVFNVVLKWQPYHSRLHLPLFALGTPFVAAVLAAAWSRLALGAVALVLAFLAVPPLLFNPSRPLVGETSILSTPRSSQYFANHPDVEGAYRAAVEFVRAERCLSVGLVRGDDWEYPLWVLLDRPGSPPVRIQHVGVPNVTARLAERPPFAGFIPCLVVGLGPRSPALRLDGRAYHRVFGGEPVTVFAPGSPSP